MLIAPRGHAEVQAPQDTHIFLFMLAVFAVIICLTYAFQCKCYDKPIGVKAVQEVYAGRDYYDRMVGVVITNQYYTQPAIELAEKLKIVLWDRDYVELM